MENTPKSLRLHLMVAGRINAGKSTLFNLISGQDAAITSPERGTTTDVVEKTMELRPLGPVVLLDTAGTDDDSALGNQRGERTDRALDRADAVLLVVNANEWGEPEETLLSRAKARKIPVIPVVNRRGGPATEAFRSFLRTATGVPALEVCAAAAGERSAFLDRLAGVLPTVLPGEAAAPPLLRDLVGPGALVVLMTPIDPQAPRGRLILPQVQAIRDALDGDAIAVTAKENAFPRIYGELSRRPDLVVCDSQAVGVMTATTPDGVPQTTFSILMARMKGDLDTLAAGCAAIPSLRPGDRVLIAESCTHHAGDDDIGRVKIPRLLEKTVGGKLAVTVSSGFDWPQNLEQYRLIVHCGGCMLNRRAMLNRLRAAEARGVAVTNYGMCISCCTGVLETVLSPFPSALREYRAALDKNRSGV